MKETVHRYHADDRDRRLIRRTHNNNIIHIVSNGIVIETVQLERRRRLLNRTVRFPIILYFFHRVCIGALIRLYLPLIMYVKSRATRVEQYEQVRPTVCNGFVDIIMYSLVHVFDLPLRIFWNLIEMGKKTICCFHCVFPLAAVIIYTVGNLVKSCYD